MKKTLCIAMLVTLSSLAAFADIPKPPKTPKPVPQAKSIDTTMSIRLDRNATEARLLIPRSQIKQLRAELEQVDGDADTTASAAGTARTQTIVGGLFLSLGFVFGGMWFVRAGRAASRTGKALVALTIMAGLGCAATIVYANAGPPAAARSITSRMFAEPVQSYRYGYGAIKLEINPNTDSDRVELIVPDPKSPDKSEE